MSKQAIIDKVAEKTGLTKKQASEAVDAVAEAINDVVGGGPVGGSVRIPPLGNFKKAHRAERSARNPQTGEPITIAAHDVIVFKQSKKN